MTGQDGLIVASSLDDEHNAVLEAHPGVAKVLARSERSWEVGKGVDALFTHQAQWTNQTRPEDWPFDLRWLQTMSAGVERLPGWVFEVPVVTRGIGVQAKAIAEYVIGAIYAAEKRFNIASLRGPEDWKPQPLGAVAGRIVGIAGLGSIGQAVAGLARANDLQVAALSHRAGQAVPGVEMVDSMADLCAISDHLVLALPLTTATRNIVNAASLAHAKAGLHLINVARGGLIDDDALFDALRHGQVGAATLDTTAPEPLPEGHPFYGMSNVRLTPHVSGVTSQSRQDGFGFLRENVDRFLRGDQLSGIVDPQKGY